MKQTIKKWALRFVLSGLLVLALLITFILNPSFLYAEKTVVGNCNIYHDVAIDSSLIGRLKEASEIIKTSTLFDAGLKYDICLNDGSYYPSLVKFILDEPIGTTFYNKLVFFGTINFKENYGLLNHKKWNMAELIAHSQTHCLQFKKFGLWKSNPIAGYPNWKWEGYAEYISRKLTNNNNLTINIGKLVETEKAENDNWIQFADGTGCIFSFYKMRLMVQYCIEIKKMNIEQLLKDKTTEELVTKEMIDWYKMKW